MLGKAGRKIIEEYFTSDLYADNIVKALECAYNKKVSC
jgi:hypothetical protein